MSIINEIKDDEKRETIKKECLTDHEMGSCPPFAIINPSCIKTQADGKDRLGRFYPWGFVDCLDPDNSDFTRLHKLVLKYIRVELIGTMHSKY